MHKFSYGTVTPKNAQRYVSVSEEEEKTETEKQKLK